MTVGLYAAMSRLRDLVEGGIPGAIYAVDSGRFRRTDQRLRLEHQPETAVDGRYELEPVSWGEPDDGAANLSGELVDSAATLVLRVGYLQGGGTMAQGDYVGIGDRMAEDAFLLRRLISAPQNFDGGDTNIVSIVMQPATFRYAVPPDRRAILEIPFRVRLEDDWSSE